MSTYRVYRTAPNGERSLLETLPDADTAAGRMVAHAQREVLDRLHAAGLDPLDPSNDAREAREEAVQQHALDNHTIAVWSITGFPRDYAKINSLADLADADELVVFDYEPGL